MPADGTGAPGRARWSPTGRRWQFLGAAALALALLAPGTGSAQAPGDDALKAGFDRAQALAGSEPERARSLLRQLREAAVAQGRRHWRLAFDELDCQLLSDIDPDAALAVAQAGVASMTGVAIDAATELPLLRLRACHAALQIDTGQEQPGHAELEAILVEANRPALEAGRAMALLERGLRRSRGGDVTRGQQDLLAACASLRALPSAFDQALCTTHLANHYRRVGDYDEALNLLRPLLDDARKRKARHDEGIYLYGIAQIHAGREDWPLALQGYADALAIETAKGDALGIAYSEYGIANALVKLKRPAEALPRIRQALEHLAALDDKRQRITTSILQAQALLAVDQAADAASALQRIEPEVRGFADEALLSDWLLQQAEALSRFDRWREAYTALAAHRDITARLQAERLSQQTARLRLQYNREHDEQDIRALQQANQQGQRMRQLQAVALTLFVLLLAATLVYAVHKVRESRRLRTLSLSDELTGLANRRAALAQARSGLQAARHKSGAYSVLMIDVDHFKRVNDIHGHATGDEVLRHLARVLPASLRSLDRLCRIGGEEFLALLPGASMEQAAAVAERMRAGVAAEAVPTGAGPLALTVSIGVATLAGADDTVESLIDRADRALYAAKNGGRNAVCRAAG